MEDSDVKEIKAKLDEILRTLRIAGLTGNSPQKVVDFGKKAREIKERLDRRNGSSPDRA